MGKKLSKKEEVWDNFDPFTDQEEPWMNIHMPPMSRNAFLSKAAIASFSALLGGNMVYGHTFPKNMRPVGLPEEPDPSQIPGKSPDLIVLNDKPWNAETPPHLLDPKVTPADLLFVRNNGIPPESVDPATWKLTIEGESVSRKVELTLADLKSKFTPHTYHLTMECGGNGRSEFNPPAKGNQWALGAVGCCKWTGVRLKDVLEYVGIQPDAVYIGYYGADRHLSGDRDKVVISRGVPIKKAMEDESLIAWSVNGQDIPLQNGAPLRLVFGGWPASTSGKWLTKIVVRNKEHDGPKMGGYSYRIPKYPVAPGTKVPEKDMKIIESMPVKSIITYPRTGAILQSRDTLEVRGHAWAGDLSVSKMEISIDFGASWKTCTLTQPVNRLAWQHWKTTVKLPELGYYEIWCKATDSKGISQPMVLPGWNPRGYLNNACHRIAVKRT